MSENKPNVVGWVDGFAAPNRIFGWAASTSFPGAQMTVVATRRGRVIGRAVCSHRREDVAHLGTSNAGYILETDATLDHIDWAAGSVTVSVVTEHGDLPLPINSDLIDASKLLEAAGRTAQLSAWDDTRLERVAEHIARGASIQPAIREHLLDLIILSGRDEGNEVVRRLTECFSSSNPQPDTEAGDGPSAAMIMDTFENLGANCEFGFVQRHYGSEPIGLLRWAFTPFPSLLACLQNEFAGVGDRENTEFLPLWGVEYGTRDIRYDLSSLTFLQAHDITDYEADFNRQLSRLRRMKEIIVERKKNQEKIFVYQTYDRISDDQIETLFEALNRYGDNVLLCVRTEEPGRPNGHVASLRPKLLIGYIDKWSRPEAVPEHIQFGSWLTICRKAYALTRPD